MKKDVIYIDIEDDITSIISKVKAAQASIVALVPPKRVGVLQSVVNLKLLQRAAGSVDKRVVLITADHALISLASGVKIPVAKTLQSKPELAHIDALEIDDNDIIDGRDVPVGDLIVPQKTDESDNDEEIAAGAATAAIAAEEVKKPALQQPVKKSITPPKKVPDFMRFRKRIFIIVGAVIALVLIYWWAFYIAPTANVKITAKTVLQNVNATVNLDAAASTSADQNTAKVSYQQVKKTVSVDFTATGKKDIGQQATGQVVFRNCETPYPQSIDAGTAVSVNGLNYITQAAVSVPAGQGTFAGCSQPGVSSAVNVIAQDIGENYNAASGVTFAVAGHSSASASYLRAVSSTAISGGSRQTVTVVTQDDIDKAKTQLTAQDQSAIKTDLTKQFGSGFHIIAESFKADAGDATPSPALGQQATQAKLSAETTYTLAGIADTDLKTLLEGYAEKTITDKDKQGVFDTGIDKVSLTKFQYLDGGKATVALASATYLGPKIDKDALKKQIVGKRYGEIEQIVKEIPNVDQVDINFAPFWVTNAPAANKITIEFSVKQNQ
jgi:hypothetical protein